MADSKIQIDLELRKEQAEQKLRNFEEMAREQLAKLQKVQARYDAKPNRFHENQVNATRQGYENRIQDIQRTQAEVEKIQMELDQNSVKKGGKLFGIAVSEQTEKFAKQFLGAYVGREIVQLGFRAAYTPGGNNAGTRQAEATAEGAMTGGAMGFAVAGPWGAAIGALTGAVLGLTDEMIKQSKELQAARIERKNARIHQMNTTGRDLSNRSFEMLIDQTPGRSQQMEMLLKRRKELMSGDGQYSLKTIEAQLAGMTDVNSNRYKQYQEMHSQVLAEKAQLEQKIFDLTATPIHRITDPSSMTDSFHKQGLYTGVDHGSSYANSAPMQMYNALLRAGVKSESIDMDLMEKHSDYARKYGDAGRERLEGLWAEKGVDVDFSKINFSEQNRPLGGIDFQALNNPVVGELKQIRNLLRLLADKGSNQRGFDPVQNRAIQIAFTPKWGN